MEEAHKYYLKRKNQLISKLNSQILNDQIDMEFANFMNQKERAIECSKRILLYRELLNFIEMGEI